jgi:type IV pilus assembly protein PilV
MKPTASQGFTMLEVLVAILVVSLGLLGLAGLQTVGIRNNAGSAQRTIATQLAYDIADRMRANFASVVAGDYDYFNYSSSSPAGINTWASGINTTTCTPGTCNSNLVAAQDIYDWNQQICAQLPQTSPCTAVVTNASVPWGIVCHDSTPNDGTPAVPACDELAGSAWVIKIWWIEDRNNPTLGLKQWVTSFQP